MHDSHPQPIHTLDTSSMERYYSETHSHCNNARCEDPKCENPNCYNYAGTHEQNDETCHDKHQHNRYYPNHHYHDVLKNILQRHYNHQDNFSDAQNDVRHHQQTLQIQQLQWVDHVLNGLVRSVLERSQDELYERGFSSGIHSELESIIVPDHCGHSNDESYEYLTAISLNFNDTPSSDPSKNITSNNQIRFYRVTDSLDIQCQFSNTKMQSKVFELSFHHGMGEGRHSHNGAQGLVENVVQDFISFILLSKRATLNSINS